MGGKYEFKIRAKKLNCETSSRYDWKTQGFHEDDIQKEINNTSSKSFTFYQLFNWLYFLADLLDCDLVNVESLQNMIENFSPAENLVELEETHLGACMYCKNLVRIDEWKVLKCTSSKCKAALVHFSCLGFEDISVQLSNEMKKNYRCRVCTKKLKTSTKK